MTGLWTGLPEARAKLSRASDDDADLAGLAGGLTNPVLLAACLLALPNTCTPHVYRSVAHENPVVGVGARHQMNLELVGFGGGGEARVPDKRLELRDASGVGFATFGAGGRDFGHGELRGCFATSALRELRMRRECRSLRCCGRCRGHRVRRDTEDSGRAVDPGYGC